MTRQRIQSLASRGRMAVASLAVVAGLSACSNLLDVDFPGRIPLEALDDPSLASTLVTGVIGDLECAYNNYAGGTAVHSDEFETSNSNVPLANWGERGINADEDDYVVGACEANQSNFGMHTVLHTARYQADTVYDRLNSWTDAQVANRRSLMATVRAYGGYAETFMGETFCQVAFSGEAAQPPTAALTRAEAHFAEAISLATAAGNADIANLARVGLARVKVDLKKWSEVAALASAVPSGYRKLADRGSENDRRWNKIWFLANNLGAYVVADEYRTMNDPRIDVVYANRGAFNPGTELWVTRKYTGLGSPIRLASYEEAQLLLAEANAQLGNVSAAMTILNARRSALGLSPLAASTQTAAVAAVLSERQRELAFEGGHRLNDILRYSTSTTNRIPWKGAFGSTKTANVYTGRPYGATTCWPFPTKESNGA